HGDSTHDGVVRQRCPECRAWTPRRRRWWWRWNGDLLSRRPRPSGGNECRSDLLGRLANFHEWTAAPNDRAGIERPVAGRLLPQQSRRLELLQYQLDIYGRIRQGDRERGVIHWVLGQQHQRAERDAVRERWGHGRDASSRVRRPSADVRSVDAVCD